MLQHFGYAQIPMRKLFLYKLMIMWKIIPSAGEETAAPSPSCVGLIDSNNGAKKQGGQQAVNFALKL